VLCCCSTALAKVSWTSRDRACQNWPPILRQQSTLMCDQISDDEKKMSSDKPPTNIYTYRDLGESDIRFLRLHTGREDEPLAGDLLHFERRSAPAYQAVSYVWGDPSLSRELYLQEGILAITASLAALLRRCRSLLGCGRLTEIMFWVDAVCTYSHRTTMNYFESLRFVPQFSEGFNFTHLASQIWQYNRRIRTFAGSE
jgi:hypothetical protein